MKSFTLNRYGVFYLFLFHVVLAVLTLEFVILQLYSLVADLIGIVNVIVINARAVC